MGVYETVSALSELLNSKPVTARQAAEKAEEMGIDLPYGTIAAYWTSGYIGRPTAKTLNKLAAVVPFTEKQLQEAAWNASSTLGPWVPPEESVLLDRRVRKALDNLIKAVVIAKGSSDAVDDHSTETTRASSKAHQNEEVQLTDEVNNRPGPSILGGVGTDHPSMDGAKESEDRHRLPGS